MKVALFLLSSLSLFFILGCSHRGDSVAKSKTTGALGLDEAFGTAGIARSPGAGGTQPDQAQIFVDVAGEKIHVIAHNGSSLYFLSFGANGDAPTDAPNVYIPALAGYGFDRDGKVVVLSNQNLAPATTRVTRYANDGTLDTSFGTAGQVIVNFEVQGFDFPVGQSTILLAGPQRSSPWDVVATRLNHDGSVDPTFGTAGQASLGGGGWDHHITNFLSQSGGKFLAASDDTLYRYLPNGARDTSFEGIPIPRDTGFYSQSGGGFQSLQEHGGQPYFYDFNLGRAVSFLVDGTRQDKQFLISGSGLHSASMIVTAAGKVVVGGTCSDPEDGWVGEADFCVFRSSDSGSIDTDFGKGGGLYISASPTGYDRLLTMTEQADGKILAFGVSQSGEATPPVADWSFVLTRIK